MVQVRSYLDIELMRTTTGTQIFHVMKNTINDDLSILHYQEIPWL
jgi:hypothetical protein